MQDMRDLYRAYSAVHDTTIKEELNTSKDQISVMNLGQLTEGDLLEVCEEIVEGLFQYGCVLDTAYEVVGSMMEASTEGELPAHRQQKIVRISEAFDKVFEKVATRAERNCEEEFLKYRTNKPLTEKWHNRVSHENGNEKLHAALIHEDRETIKGGLIEMLSDIIEARKPGESMKDYARRLNKDTSKVSIGMDSDPLNDPDDDGTGGAGYQKNVSGKKVIRMASKRLNQKEEFEEVSTLRQGWTNAYASIYEKKLDPVGQEDGDVNNDNKKDKTDSYLMKRRAAIGKAMKEEGEIRYPTEPKKKFSKDKTDPGVAAGRKAAKEMGLKHNEEVNQYVDFLISEGYDCSDLTWDDMSEEYQSLDEGLRSAVMGFLGKKKEEPAKPMSRGDQLRKKYNVGPEKSDTSAKAQILQRTRAKAEKDQKQYGDSPYSKGVAAKSKAAHERQLKGGYSKYGADDARGSGNKARKRAAALTKEELEQIDEMGKSDAGVRSRMKISGYEPPTNWDKDANRGKGATVSPKQAEKRRRKSLRQEEVTFSEDELARIEEIVNSWVD